MIETKEILTMLVWIVQGLVAWAFVSTKADLKEDIGQLDLRLKILEGSDFSEKLLKVTREDIKDIEKKIEKIETGDFVEKIVKSTIYAPESREYFKNIFKESLAHALAHQQKNDITPLVNILDRLSEIEKKIT